MKPWAVAACLMLLFQGTSLADTGDAGRLAQAAWRCAALGEISDNPSLAPEIARLFAFARSKADEVGPTAFPEPDTRQLGKNGSIAPWGGAATGLSNEFYSGAAFGYELASEEALIIQAIPLGSTPTQYMDQKRSMAAARFTEGNCALLGR